MKVGAKVLFFFETAKFYGIFSVTIARISIFQAAFTILCLGLLSVIARSSLGEGDIFYFFYLPMSQKCCTFAANLQYGHFQSHNHARDGQCAGDAVLQHLLHASRRERYTAEAKSVFSGTVIVPDDLERIAL